MKIVAGWVSGEVIRVRFGSGFEVVWSVRTRVRKEGFGQVLGEKKCTRAVLYSHSLQQSNNFFFSPSNHYKFTFPSTKTIERFTNIYKKNSHWILSNKQSNNFIRTARLKLRKMTLKHSAELCFHTVNSTSQTMIKTSIFCSFFTHTASAALQKIIQ